MGGGVAQPRHAGKYLQIGAPMRGWGIGILWMATLAGCGGGASLQRSFVNRVDLNAEPRSVTVARAQPEVTQTEESRSQAPRAVAHRPMDLSLAEQPSAEQPPTVATADAEPNEPRNAVPEENVVALANHQVEAELPPSPANGEDRSADDEPPLSFDVLANAQPAIQLEDVIASVYESYPELREALFSRNVALGEQIQALGEFDLKLKGASENSPTGFYKTYRQSIGAVQPLYSGGEAFAGYRIGRGSFEPWYEERQTNDGGEFKTGFALPLLQNVDIDPRRAGLWSAEYGRQLVEPEIQAQLIGFVQAASYAYWDWVAAGENFRIAERVLRLAEDRTSRIKQQVEQGLIDPPELTDNLRLVAERKAKLAESRQKLEQAAIRLSLYLRDGAGNPQVPLPEQLPRVPELGAPVVEPADVERALGQRPELKVLAWEREILNVAYAQAENEMLPRLDGVVAASQDMGEPTSSKRDKSRFELEAGLYLDVPLQRRKARGKITAIEGKLAQLSARTRMVSDRIVTDVQSARVALTAARQQVEETAEAVRLAEDLAERERRNFEEGLSDLLTVTLREQFAVESAQKYVAALQLYYEAEADYRAALGVDDVP